MASINNLLLFTLLAVTLTNLLQQGEEIFLGCVWGSLLRLVVQIQLM